MPDRPSDNLIYAAEAFQIQGAVFAVYRAMGAGFLEAVYQECLAMEFERRELPFRAQPPLRLQYCGRELRARYAPDFICFDRIIVELKAVGALAAEHRAQLINYLRDRHEARPAGELRLSE